MVSPLKKPDNCRGTEGEGFDGDCVNGICTMLFSAIGEEVEQVPDTKKREDEVQKQSMKLAVYREGSEGFLTVLHLYSRAFS